MLKGFLTTLFYLPVFNWYHFTGDIINYEDDKWLGVFPEAASASCWTWDLYTCLKVRISFTIKKQNKTEEWDWLYLEIVQLVKYGSVLLLDN